MDIPWGFYLGSDNHPKNHYDIPNSNKLPLLYYPIINPTLVRSINLDAHGFFIPSALLISLISFRKMLKNTIMLRTIMLKYDGIHYILISQLIFHFVVHTCPNTYDN